jgi:Mg2+-importing ATPase
MYHGLTTTEAKARLHDYGLNEVPPVRWRFLRLLWRQLKSVFMVLLLSAAVATWLLGETFDAVFILLFVVLGIGLSLFQEYQSGAAAETLRRYLVRTSTVRRDNQDVEIPVVEVVPGDILKLESGEIVPADAVIRYAHGLQVDESTFSGESVVVAKEVAAAGVAEAASHLLQGTVVVRGLAYAEVTATGACTRLAAVATAAGQVGETSEVTKGLDRISTFIMRATVVTLIGMVVANALIEGSSADIPHLLIFAIALAVSVIPEALPLVMTFSLSRGALRLAREHVIVKRLTSVQDLGSIELLCTDKTGTITENHLVYVNEYIMGGVPWHPLVLSRLTAHDLSERQPEPFDRATDEALSPEQRAIVAGYTLIEEEPFDPALRSNGALVQHAGGQQLHLRRGSPEYFFAQGLVDPAQVGGWLHDEEEAGRRVIGVSYDDGTGMRFGGFLSFTDTLKSTTTATLQEAQKLNVAVTIITGDSLRVAAAIGRQVSLIERDEQVIEAANFFALPPEVQQRRLSDIRVFARTTPEQKLSLITLLRQRSVVGFLGEGINDAAALRAANVSLVVPSASDVARETADIVLTRADLRVIIDGIRLGRETHANTEKYIRATLVSNFGNFYAVAVASLFITFLPMLPKQLLLLNLLSDFPMMAIAFDRVSRQEIARPQRYDFRSLYIIFITLGLVSTIFDFLWFALFYTEGAGVLQTNWFIASVVTEILLLLSIRSLLPIERAGLPAPIILWLSGAALVAALFLPMIPLTAYYFSFTPPTMADVGLIIGLAALYLAVTELVKRPLARFLKQR